MANLAVHFFQEMMQMMDPLSCPKLHLNGLNAVTWSSGRIPLPLYPALPCDSVHLLFLPFWNEIKMEQTCAVHQQSLRQHRKWCLLRTEWIKVSSEKMYKIHAVLSLFTSIIVYINFFDWIILLCAFTWFYIISVELVSNWQLPSC